MSGNEGAHTKIEMGVDIGEPDLWIYCNTKEEICHILRLELKRKKPHGKLSDNQIEWNEWFDENYGDCKNMVRAVAYGLQEAKQTITNWLEGLK